LHDSFIDAGNQNLYDGGYIISVDNIDYEADLKRNIDNQMELNLVT